MAGYIKLHRQIWDNPRSKDSAWVSIWLYLLTHATHAEIEVVFSGVRIKLKPGQLITGRQKIACTSGVAESKVQRILKTLESEHQIEQQMSNKNRLITIVNWNKYQQGEHQIEQQVNNNRTTSEQQVNTNKNVKECKRMLKKTTAAKEKYPKMSKDVEVAKKKLEKWFSRMETVHNPKGLASWYISKYPSEIILKALENSNCISRGRLNEIIEYKLKDLKNKNKQLK